MKIIKTLKNHYQECFFAKNFKFQAQQEKIEKQLKPSQIVEFLDEHIISQERPKKLLAIAFRNRIRRKLLPEQYQEEIIPKNILMKGSTGSGKTELARRIAQKANSPFIKVEATHYTEIGYYGKDVTTIIEDLVKLNQQRIQNKFEKIQKNLQPQLEKFFNLIILDIFYGEEIQDVKIRQEKLNFIEMGFYENRKIYVNDQIHKIKDGFTSLEQFFSYLYKFRENVLEELNKYEKITIAELRSFFMSEFYRNFIKKFNIDETAIKQVEDEGIIFIDEIDKIASSKDLSARKSPSTDGVQRDLLPLIEGTTISTKLGKVNTQHILFICAGAFSVSKPEDLLPELLGRLPIRVDLKMLSKEDFVKILTLVKFNILEQYRMLLETDKILIQFQPCAIDRLAQIAQDLNYSQEDFGARRLFQLVEGVLEDLSYGEEIQEGTFMITKEYVDQKLKEITKDFDLKKYLV